MFQNNFIIDRLEVSSYCSTSQPSILQKNGNTYEHLKIRSFVMRVFALFFIAILTISVSNAHAFTNGNSEKGMPEGFYSFGKGILELQGIRQTMHLSNAQLFCKIGKLPQNQFLF